MKKALVITGTVVLVIAAAIKFSNKHEDVQSKTRFLMDTFCTIQVPGGIEVLEAIDLAFRRIEEVDRKFNSLNPESPVYAFNNFNEPIEDAEIVRLVRDALEICEISGGAFDITVFPLIDIWGFFTETPDVPEKKTIEAALQNIGYEKLVIENNTLKKLDDTVKIDLGAIAKGYAIREAINVLKQWNIGSALVDAGGDIYALGSFNGHPWTIGIQNPRGDGVIGALELEDCAVVTSGDYERYFEKEGKRYHHILDPRTGYSAEGLISVTVISSDPVLADAWSTAIFVLGREKSLDLMKHIDLIEAMLIDSNGEKYYSQNMHVSTSF